MNNKVVLVPFPFDDLTTQKIRPAVCLTDTIRPYNHLVLAYITSKVAPNPSKTDLIIDSKDADFGNTGLKVSSTIQFHRLVTVSKRILKRELGELSANQQSKIEERLRELFEI